jgi:trk system potassium uptake protein TrkH
MAGSTSGGPKIVRVLLLTKVVVLQFARLSHPKSQGVVRLAGSAVDERALIASLGFMAMWGLLLGLGTLALSSVGSDLISSLSAAAVCLANIGPGLGAVGPSHTFASVDPGAKLVMEALMLLGRLEIYTLLIVLTPSFWRF